MTVTGLRFDPAVPWWLLAVLAGLCVATLAVALWRRARGTGWRALAFAILLAWLAGPALVRQTQQILPDVAVLVMDDSGSMQLHDRAALRDAARVQIEAAAKRLPGLELRTVTVPEGTEGTALFAAIGRTLSDIPPSRLSAVIALTDGMVHDAPASLPYPLHVLIPARGEETDRRIRVVEAPQFGVVGSRVTIRAAIDDLGVANPGAAQLSVRQDDGPPDTRDVPPRETVEIDVPITHAGPTVVELEAAALPGETSPLNNRAVVTINGVRDRLRVLLVSGEPHQGERTWRRLLKADPAVDLVHFTILRLPEREDFTPLNELALIAFPVRELFQVKIREFDLIILDRFQNRGTLPPLYLRNIADYVQAGGALLLSAGPEFAGTSSLAETAIGTVLPGRPLDRVVDGAFRPQVTPAGQRHPVTAGLPGVGAWGPWYRRIPITPTTAPALLQAEDGGPLLVLDRVGSGRVALLLSDQIWLWSRGHLGGGPQAELLRRIAHWLMQEPALEEESLRAAISQGGGLQSRLSIERHSMSDADAPPVTVTSPGGATQTVTLAPPTDGTARAEVAAIEPGVWRVTDGTRTVLAAAASANPQELADLRATATVLAPVVRGSGSVRFIGAGIPEIRRTEPGREVAGSTWIGLPVRHDSVVTGAATTPLLPPWAALPLLLGTVLVAWRREGAG